MKRLLLPLLLAFLSTLVTGRADDAALTVAISIPHTDDHPGILNWAATDHNAHFHVVLTNVSNEPKRLFQEWCSWGYSALSFEITDEHGKTWIARKGPNGWTMNYPAYWTVPPQECFVIDVYFADHQIWQDQFWLPPGHPTGRVTLKAIYRVQPDESSTKFGVWTGTSTSKPVECLIK
ncbi:MAG: hypothetical protein P4L99_03960 [Chthoniobacter sp.]|nr:hypothetical protein [Chthoniobacter sp.]